MPAGNTNKTNLASIESAIATFESNASQATGSAQQELKVLARTLKRDIATFKRSIQDLG